MTVSVGFICRKTSLDDQLVVTYENVRIAAGSETVCSLAAYRVVQLLRRNAYSVTIDLILATEIGPELDPVSP